MTLKMVVPTSGRRLVTAGGWIDAGLWPGDCPCGNVVLEFIVFSSAAHGAFDQRAGKAI
jgi:hypothetical protein